MRQPPSLPSLEEQVRELTKKVKWLKWENEELQRKNRSLETQLRKFYR
jgi:predicted RNase H-like nuclease (RuvC/YqgF family)